MIVHPSTVHYPLRGVSNITNLVPKPSVLTLDCQKSRNLSTLPTVQCSLTVYQIIFSIGLLDLFTGMVPSILGALRKVLNVCHIGFEVTRLNYTHFNSKKGELPPANTQYRDEVKYLRRTNNQYYKSYISLITLID